MDKRLIDNAWADFSWKIIQHIECPVHKHKLTKDWENFAEKMQELSN
jgi:hypothetical protein